MQEEEQQNTPQAITLTNTSLIKYTLMSAVFAVFILLAIVLPAEYNIDPMGIGEKLGLTVFKTTNNILPASTQLTSSETANKALDNLKTSNEVINVTVPAGRGVEYKFTMQQFQKLTYDWQTDSSPLYFDLHGEPEGDTTGYFESYAIATVQSMKGSFTAPFSGVHGWYWKNTSDNPITVKLTVTGQYSQHGLK